MNHNLICKVMGLTLALEGGCMLLPLVVSLLYGERSVAFVFCTAAVFCTVFGLLLLCLQQQRKAKIQVREGFFAVAFSWIVISVFGAVPYWMCGLNRFRVLPPPEPR